MAILLPWVQYTAGISLFAGDALLSSLYLSGLLAAIFVGYAFSCQGVGQRALGLMGLMHCLWFAAMVSAAIGLTQWLNLQDSLGMYILQTDIGDRAKGNLGQPNQLATLLLMGMAAFAYVYEQRLIGRFAFFLGIAFMTMVLILTQSRAGMLSVLLVTVFLIWKKRTVELRLSTNAVAWWAICFFIGTLFLPYLSEALLLGDVRGVTSTEAISQRWRMWQQVAYAVAQSPWVGYGWNQTPTAHAAGAVAFPGDFT
ncbi:MAG: O-antigen ligase family protein, partial [Gallionella sp.]|nr:O-antigen ligase family protein [Gallionella sp.]